MTAVFSSVTDEGQPFEVNVLDARTGRRFTLGWTTAADGAELMDAARCTPAFADPQVIPRRPAVAWFLSFRGGRRDGATILKAPDIGTAIRLAWRLGLNPGGQVAFTECDDTPEARVAIEQLGGLGKFITVEQLKALPHRSMFPDGW